MHARSRAVWAKRGGTYQSAHDDLAGSSRSNGGGVDDLGRSLGGLGSLLYTADGRRRGGAASSATTTSILATVADEIVERLVQVGRHCDELVWLRDRSKAGGLRSQADKSRQERVGDGYEMRSGLMIFRSEKWLVMKIDQRVVPVRRKGKPGVEEWMGQERCDEAERMDGKGEVEAAMGERAR